jgi:hypothetical protein
LELATIKELNVMKQGSQNKEHSNSNPSLNTSNEQSLDNSLIQQKGNNSEL